MIKDIWMIIVRTPLWVWAILAWLLYRGIRALKSRTIKIYKIFILPTIFLLLSVKTVFYKNGLVSHKIPLWLAFLCIGALLGFYLIKNMKIKVDRKNGLIQLPGSVATLVMILSIFSIKYYFGYKMAMTPDVAKDAMFLMMNLILMGFVKGISVGRALCYFYKYKTVEQTDLR